jgi:Holliday junction resolvase RusA-like endonuclease
MIKTKVIPIKFPTLNDFIDACKIQRGRWNKGNQMKQEFQQTLYFYFCKLPELKTPVSITFVWIEKNKRRDLDNVSAVGRKFILDTLQLCGKLKNDNLNYVIDLHDKVKFGDNYGVILEIEEGTEC